jgi:hypothetical protein
MASGILDPDLHALRVVGHYLTFSDGEAAIACFHLNAVGNTEADSKAERLRQPSSRYARIGQVSTRITVLDGAERLNRI